MPASEPRRVPLLPILIGTVPVLLLLATMIVGLLSIEGDTVLVGSRRGPWTRYPTRSVQAVALAVLAPLTALIVGGLIHAVIQNLRAKRSASAPPAGLALGEPVVWRGRQGWRGVGAARYGIAALATVGPLLYGW